MTMVDFIAEVVDQRDDPEGKVITVRMTGFGPPDGALLPRAKARAILAAGFGSFLARGKRTVNKRTFTRIRDDVEDKEITVPAFMDRVEERIEAVQDESLMNLDASEIRSRLEAFRQSGLFVEVQSVEEMEPEEAVGSLRVQREFGVFKDAISTYKYEILVTTNFSFG